MSTLPNYQIRRYKLLSHFWDYFTSIRICERGFQLDALSHFRAMLWQIFYKGDAMSKTDLVGVFAELPESYQQQAILNCMFLTSARSEYGIIDRLLARISELNNFSIFKGTALVIGIQCAVSANNLPLAMARLDTLDHLGNHPAILNARANALLHLAPALLPDYCTRLMELWTQLVQICLPAEARNTCRHIGIMLVKEMRKNYDSATAHTVRDMMKRYLA